MIASISIAQETIGRVSPANVLAPFSWDLYDSRYKKRPLILIDQVLLIIEASVYYLEEFELDVAELHLKLQKEMEMGAAGQPV